MAGQTEGQQNGGKARKTGEEKHFWKVQVLRAETHAGNGTVTTSRTAKHLHSLFLLLLFFLNTFRAGEKEKTMEGKARLFSLWNRCD